MKRAIVGFVSLAAIGMQRTKQAANLRKVFKTLNVALCNRRRWHEVTLAIPTHLLTYPLVIPTIASQLTPAKSISASQNIDKAIAVPNTIGCLPFFYLQ